jgi:hypothetical protein
MIMFTKQGLEMSKSKRVPIGIQIVMLSSRISKRTCFTSPLGFQKGSKLNLNSLLNTHLISQFSATGSRSLISKRNTHGSMQRVRTKRRRLNIDLISMSNLTTASRLKKTVTNAQSSISTSHFHPSHAWRFSRRISLGQTVKIKKVSAYTILGLHLN